jgi:hypothetical protein
LGGGAGRETTIRKEEDFTIYVFYKRRGVIARSEFLPLDVPLSFTIKVQVKIIAFFSVSFFSGNYLLWYISSLLTLSSPVMPCEVIPFICP